MGKLTDRQISNLKPGEKDAFVSDGGGLYLRVRTSGGKFWLYRYKANGSTKWVDIGVYPGVSLAQARAEAAKLTHMREAGEDPVEQQKKVAEEKQNAVEAARQEQAKIEARITVSQLLDRWQRTDLRNRKDAGAEVRRSFEKDVLPRIGDVAAEDVSRSMIAGILDDVVDRGAPILARNLLGDLRQMFVFAVKREIVPLDPTAILKQDDYGKKKDRERVLNEAEIKELHVKYTEFDPYTLLAQNTDSGLLSLDAQGTFFNKLQTLVDRPAEENIISNTKQIENSIGYLLRLKVDGLVLYMVKKTGNTWKTKRAINVLNVVLLNANQLDLVEDRSFSISKTFDYFAVDGQIFVANKAEFESLLNYKTLFAQAFQTLQADATFQGVFSNMQPLVDHVGTNAMHLRRMEVSLR